MKPRLLILGAGSIGAGMAAMLSGKGYDAVVGAETKLIPAIDHKGRTVARVERLDIEAWNAAIEERKAAKRRAKGTK